MPRPDFVTNDDISRWSENIDNDVNLSVGLATNPIFREVLYAGLWLVEQLIDAGCPNEYITRIQFTAGQLSYKHDPWQIHQYVWKSYLNSELDFDTDVLN